MEKPLGNFCQPSLDVFGIGGFQATHKTVSKYLAWSAANPEGHSDFLSAQTAYIMLKNKDPDAKVGKKRLRNQQVTIENEEEDIISDEELDFVTLQAWQEERKEFKCKKTGKLPHPSDFKIELKFRKTRKHPQGTWGVYELVGKAGHHRVHRRLVSRVKRQRVMQDHDEEEIREGQTDDIFSGAAKDSLSKCDESEIADEEADADLEEEMSNIVSSNRATFGVHAEDKPVAKAKAGKHASKLMAFKNRDKLKGLQSSGSSSVVVKAIGSKAVIKGGAAPSQPDAKKWDEQHELVEYNKLETDALKHLLLGSGTSPKERDAWSKMMKSEKDVQRGCNDILLKLARRTSSSAFKAFVSEELNTKFLSLRMKLQTRVALAKYIGQSHITDVSKYQEAMDKASDEFWWEVPFHMHAHLLKMHLADGVRLGEFEKVVQVIQARQQALQECRR